MTDTEYLLDTETRRTVELVDAATPGDTIVQRICDAFGLTHARTITGPNGWPQVTFEGAEYDLTDLDTWYDDGGSDDLL